MTRFSKMEAKGCKIQNYNKNEKTKNKTNKDIMKTEGGRLDSSLFRLTEGV